MQKISAFLLLALILVGQRSLGQGSEIINSFETYTELPREVVSLHLNKTVFLKGEEIGFQAYVFEKGTHQLSRETNNLYVVLMNSNDSVIKEQLVLVQDGFGHGTFALDKSVNAGDYTIKAFTNWMRNFSEKNHYSQNIHVIEPNIPLKNTAQNKNAVDAQVLPEGGHAIARVENTFGVIIKDSNGYGIANVKGTVVDSHNRLITNFKLDQFGIGRFILIPMPNMTYFANFKVGEKAHRIKLGPFKSEGVSLQLTDLREDVGIVFNKKGIDENKFHLAVHNGMNIKMMDIDFSSNSKQIVLLKKEELYQGVNIFTLFDSHGSPILERVYFNFDYVPSYSSLQEPTIKKLADSVKITFSLNDLDLKKLSKLSVSVLPEKSMAYGSPHTVASYLHLAPYLRGNVQDASYYFNKTDIKKKHQFDNLLITQGWSSYDWYGIKNKPPQYLFDFEKGISIIGQDNEKIDEELFLYPLENNDFRTFSINESTNTFVQNLIFPYKDEVLRLSEMDDAFNAEAAQLYMRFKPNAVPEINWQNDSSNGLKNYYNILDAEDIIRGFEGFDEIIGLSEVTVEANRRMERLKKIKDRSNGQVFIFGENDFRRNLFLDEFLVLMGFNPGELMNTFQQGPITPAVRDTRPRIYLDDILMNDFRQLNMWRMEIVDYIEINRFGTRTGAYHPSGEIRIFTDPSLSYAQFNKTNPYNEIDVPLAFTRPKRFYTPKYNNYNDPVYSYFGAIDWHPNLSADASGNISFKIPNVGLLGAKLFIEGVVNNDQLVSEVIELSF